MANLAPGDTAAAGLLALNQARDVDEAGKAAAMITAPVQNLVVADRQRIALYVTGRVPIRRAGDGSAPVPGDGRTTGPAGPPASELPHVVAPASGRLVNANDRVAPPDFPVFLGRDWFGDWRARAHPRAARPADRHTAGGFRPHAGRRASSFARQILPRCSPFRPREDTAARRAQALLRDWDGSMTADAPQPLIFTAWMDHFMAACCKQADISVDDGAPLAEFAASCCPRPARSGAAAIAPPRFRRHSPRR